MDKKIGKVTQALSANRAKLPAFTPPAIMGDAMPVGSVIAFAGEIRTSGDKPFETNLPMFNWLKCDGSSLEVAQYPELFSALGYRYGGSGQKFNLPDLRGEFLRGVDVDSSNNKKASLEGRKGAANGGNHEVGSTQGFALQSHVHTYQKPKRAMPILAEPGVSTTQIPLSQEDTSTPKSSQKNENLALSDKETRPVNTFVYWLIKTKL
ncbi:35 kDa protein-like [Marinomonas sp. MED121]|uniref:phage tail protein n=1 Tax=Marinomonas sp. MED121 TaxID=314277 RepID=UPI0000690A35|nr:phage tail protein [Marinomonas sp. MED121]EAQ64010.1 35 kDa protein-like [Marinomonas sp. MED121]